MRRPGEEAALVEIKRPRRERQRAWRQIGRTQWLIASPLIVIVVFFVVALTVYPPLYVLFGTSVPGLVNKTGEKGPVPTEEKVRALGVWIPWMLILGYLAWQAARRRFQRPYLAIDSDGVWPVFGGRVRDGLEWGQIAAVHVVTGGSRTTVPADVAAPPFVEVFTKDAIKDPGGAGVPATMIVNAASPAPKLRGKRYVVELEGPPSDVDGAVERFAPDKRLVIAPRSAPD